MINITTPNQGVKNKFDYSSKYNHEVIKKMLANGNLIPLAGVVLQNQEEKNIEERLKQEKKEHWKLVRFVSQKILKQFASKGYKTAKSVHDINNFNNIRLQAQEIINAQSFKEKFKKTVSECKNSINELLSNAPSIEKDIKKSLGINKFTP